VSIEDDGQGISPDNAGKIFDPFFTTRAPGSGTGLGLYLSSQILLEHGGRLRHESRAGGGARFAFDVPVAAA
jgi:signal transduction histidine kinase